jgi:hypothetical protein
MKLLFREITKIFSICIMKILIIIFLSPLSWSSYKFSKRILNIVNAESPLKINVWNNCNSWMKKKKLVNMFARCIAHIPPTCTRSVFNINFINTSDTKIVNIIIYFIELNIFQLISVAFYFYISYSKHRRHFSGTNFRIIWNYFFA